MIIKLKSNTKLYGIITEGVFMDNENFSDLTDDMLDDIQKSIQTIIEHFDVPEDNKNDVIRKINFMYTKTREMSITDSLTKLYNRRYFENISEREFMRSVRYKSPLTFAIIDIDFFKKINDTFGHQCGDMILREVAYTINESFRKTDYVFRYGGEEFVVILTDTDENSALCPIERLREKIEKSEFMFDGKKVNVTISVGFSSDTINASDAFELFGFADKALYLAKENGRNQVRIYRK